MTFPAYPDYRDSGVEWLGAVPRHWESWKISHAFGELGSGTTPPTTEAEWYENGTVPWVTTGELRESVIWETKKLLSHTALPAFSALRLHPAGSLAIAMYGATIGRLGILGVDATTNQACCLLTRPHHLHVKFTFYWLLVFKQSIIDLYASGGGQPNINQEIIANLKVPAPGIPEQTQIAQVLDHETARIDALIEEQQRLIELLKEKRQAVISHAVTKGLDPTVPMKDSGVEWLGEVPAHWAIKRLKQLVIDVTGIQMGPFGGMLLELDESDTGYKVFGQENTISGNFSSGNRWISEQRYFALSNYHLEVGDIVLTRKGSLGNCRRVSFLPQAGIIDSDTIRVRAKDQMMSPDYLELLLHEAGYISTQLGLVKRGAILSGLNSEIIANLVIVAPPRKEQEELLREIKAVLSIFDQGISDCEYAVGLLRERRSALISAAVTGKIDVRGWQPPATTQAPEFEVAEAN